MDSSNEDHAKTTWVERRRRMAIKKLGGVKVLVYILINNSNEFLAVLFSYILILALKDLQKKLFYFIHTESTALNQKIFTLGRGIPFWLWSGKLQLWRIW